MSTYNFNIKGKTKTIKSIQQDFEKQAKQIADLIVQTIFIVDDSITKSNLLDTNAAKIEILKSVHKYRDRFTIMSQRLLNLKLNLNHNVNYLIDYIALNLNFCSNKIILNKESVVNNTKINPDTYYKCIDVLVELDVIARTTKRNVYVINHNMLFKGSYDKFITNYVSIYHDALFPVVTKDKKIVLDKDYGK